MDTRQRARKAAQRRAHAERRDNRLPGGWTRIALATEMGVSREVLHRWLTGRAPWPAARLTQAAGLLGVEESALTVEARS